MNEHLMAGIKAVIFDQGNVLDSYDKANRTIASRLGFLDYDDFVRFAAPYVRPFHLGMPEMKFLENVCRDAHIRPPERPIILDIYNAERTLNEGLLDVVAHIKSHGLKTGIISNAEIPLKHFLEERKSRYSRLFDTITLSCDEKIAKPDVEIFTRTLVRLGVEARNAVYVDDVAKYVAIFESLGGKGIHFTGNEKAVKGLSDILGRQLTFGK